jgi:hypothetical protein
VSYTQNPGYQVTSQNGTLLTKGATIMPLFR